MRTRTAEAAQPRFNDYVVTVTPVFTNCGISALLRRWPASPASSSPACRITSRERGDRGERIFFQPDDTALYKDWLAESCRRFGVACWAYCLMPNPVHLILAPDDGDGLALALSRGAGSMPASSTRGRDFLPPSGLQCSHISGRRADPFPSLLGKVARSAGWGVARCYDARRLARTLPRTCGPSALLSTPHPSPSATPSPLRGEGGARRPPAGSMTCVNSVALWGRMKEGVAPDLESFVSTPPRRWPRDPPPLPAPTIGRPEGRPSLDGLWGAERAELSQD